MTNKPTRFDAERALTSNRIMNKPYFFIVAGVLFFRLLSILPSSKLSFRIVDFIAFIGRSILKVDSLRSQAYEHF